MRHHPGTLRAWQSAAARRLHALYIAALTPAGPQTAARRALHHQGQSQRSRSTAVALKRFLRAPSQHAQAACTPQRPAKAWRRNARASRPGPLPNSQRPSSYAASCAASLSDHRRVRHLTTHLFDTFTPSSSARLAAVGTVTRSPSVLSSLRLPCRPLLSPSRLCSLAPDCCIAPSLSSPSIIRHSPVAHDETRSREHFVARRWSKTSMTAGCHCN